uniref:NADH dehydrogenase subunit 6 n=1 Tax=Aleurochiton aceris TaxID=266942 RepID=Q697H2_ALEAC|nr:NADH dehydrogenase subunit 6 [Aleurochiton aceris]
MSYNPLFLILLLVLFLFYVVLLMVFYMNSYFYSYLVFLLFMSGLMVMFLYLCSVILNEKLVVNVKITVALLSLLVLTVISTNLIMFINNLTFNIVYYEFYNLLKFFVYSYNIFSLFFMFYLLACLVVAYELIKKIKGPLRAKN